MKNLALLLIITFSYGAIAADHGSVAPKTASHPEAPKDYKVLVYADQQKELAQIATDLKVRPSSRNCGIRFPFNEEELHHFHYDPPKTYGDPTLSPATQYRTMTGWRNLAKFVRENGVSLNGITAFCIGAESAGPTVDGEVVVAWNANAKELKALLGHLPTKGQFNALQAKVAAKEREIELKYGVKVQDGGRYASAPGAAAANVFALLDSIERALAKKTVQQKRIDQIFLALDPSPEAMSYVVDNPGSGLGEKKDWGFVSLNARIVDPAQIESLLASDRIPNMPTAETYEQLNRALGQATNPLLRQRLLEVKGEFSEFQTADRHEKNKLILQIGDQTGLGFYSSTDQPRAELPLLQRMAAMPRYELRPQPDQALTDVQFPYPGENKDGVNTWTLGAGFNSYSGHYGTVKLALDATPDEIRSAVRSIPKTKEIQATLDLLRKNGDLATAEFGKKGVQFSDGDTQSMNFHQLEQKARLLGELAAHFRGAMPQGGKPITSLMFRARPDHDGARIWVAKEFSNTIAISVEATEADLKAFLEPSSLPR